MIASVDNNYRKPRIGFYTMLEKMYLEKIKKFFNKETGGIKNVLGS